MDFTLPGAEKFSAYLQSIVQGELTVEGPEVIDFSYGIDYTKQWAVKLDGEILGVYRTFGPKSEKSDFGRAYDGRIPGYVNDAILIHNRFREEKLPVDAVTLSWSNKKFVAGSFSENTWPQIIEVPWSRQDGHEIPFP